MRKYCKIFLIIVLTFLVSTIQVKGESAGSTGGGSHGGSADGWKWEWANSDSYGRQGIRVTAYDRNTATKYGSVFYVNDKGGVNNINEGLKGKLYIKTNRSERLSDNYTYQGQWTKATGNVVKYLGFKDIFNNTTTTDIIKFFGFNNETEVINALKDVYADVDSSNLKNIVLVIEPATFFKDKTTGKHYFGTYWDFQYMKKNNNAFNLALWSLFNGDNMFGNAIRIPKNDISGKPQIKEFLKKHFSTFFNNSQSQIQYGVGIILASDFINTGTITPPSSAITTRECITTIGKGSCVTDYSFIEPTDKDCVVNNDLYKYKSVGDCGIIYCSQSLKTNLNEFYQTFTPIIRSGSYFKMNNIEVDIEKTCYLKSVSNSNICSNWATNITKDKANSINLKLISNYNLIENSGEGKFEVKCSSYKNGVCSKATVIQHIEYGLEPNTNRFISIKDMAGTATQTGNNVIDLGGEHLTTPLSLSTGTHTYTVDYSNSILSNVLGRLRTSTVRNNDTNMILNYKFQILSGTRNFTRDDLIYSCNYETKKDFDPESTSENPTVSCDCESECCDANCNPILCSNPDESPGGFPGNIVYRPINLVEAFPGQYGTGRDIGSNWEGYVYNEEGNTINKSNGQPYTKEEYYINYNRGYDNYDIYESEPLYVIKLDYTTISKIREYNDRNKNNYNDFNLKCTLGTGTECISDFLHGDVIKPGGIIESGTCKDINSSNFDICVQRIK